MTEINPDKISNPVMFTKVGQKNGNKHRMQPGKIESGTKLVQK